MNEEQGGGVNTDGSLSCNTVTKTLERTSAFCPADPSETTPSKVIRLKINTNTGRHEEERNEGMEEVRKERHFS